MSLKEYNRKRRFDKTPEPAGEVAEKKGPLSFVVQLHSATRLHYDFRLELDGVHMSWAVPKGPSLNPNDQRLAVRTEDHPLAYGGFEGVIPKGNYGAGTVMLWDVGTFVERSAEDRDGSEERLRKGMAEGHITFVMSGHKLAGEFALLRLEKDKTGKAWLLVKKRDAYASYSDDVTTKNRSVATGRNLAEIAAEAPSKGEIWLPGKGPVDAAQLKAALTVAPQDAPQPRARKSGRAVAPTVDEAAPKTLAEAPKEKLPRLLKPMLASEAEVELNSPGWIYEPRFDGFRAMAEVEAAGVVRLHSRQGLSYDKIFPEVTNALKSLRRNLVLDGELVVLGEDGRPSRALLKAYGEKHEGAPVFFVHDLLHADGKNLRSLPLAVRKKELTAVLAGVASSVRLNEHRDDNLAGAEADAAELGAAGLTARHRDSPYKSGVSPFWVRLPDIGAKEQSPQVALTNLERLYFPSDGYKKGDVVDYYRAVAPILLPHLKDRPQSLHRHPNGIDAEGFFQKDMVGFLPPWVATVRVASASAQRSIDYLLCQNEATLLYMANLGCIEINPWLSRVPHLDELDYTVIDIDPDEQGFGDVVTVAQHVHEVLTAAGIRSRCKTSGATGLHIYVPLTPGCDFDKGRQIAQAACQLVEARLPELTTLERTPSRRRRRIYLDCLQNRRGQTLAAPYCIRPRAGATVSAPLAWDEVVPGLDPRDFTLRTMPERLSRVGDLWADLAGDANDPGVCLAALAALS